MDKVLVLKATENGTVGVEMPFDKEAGLDFYYQNLDCDTIDIVEAHGLVELKLKDFCLVCDDEGIFNGGKVNGIASLLYGFMNMVSRWLDTLWYARTNTPMTALKQSE